MTDLFFDIETVANFDTSEEFFQINCDQFEKHKKLVHCNHTQFSDLIIYSCVKISN